MAHALDNKSIDQLFTQARSHNAWQATTVEDEVLRRLYDVVKMGPTSANGSPARFVFVKSPEAKTRLKACLAPTNVEKTMAAPVTVIVGYDTEFYEKLPELFPHADARPWFVGNPELIQSTAFRNSSLQGAYLILAARGLGLDCGPMSGFDNEKVDAEFFPDGRVKSNFLVNLGYGDSSKLFPRGPRLAFEEACQIV
jgi:3-hydroxypropanoate dehydrogenase